MRLIDEKGRLLGLVNIFDILLIILIFGMMIPGIKFYYKHRNQEKLPEEANRYGYVYKYVKANTCLFQDVADRIKKGDSLLDSSGNVIWEIDRITSNESVVVEAAPKKEGSKVKVATYHTRGYSLAGSKGDVSTLGDSSENEGPKTVELASLRNVEISLKLWCKIEKNGALTIVKDGGPLLSGTKIQLLTNSYNVFFIIVEGG